ncbi:MAG TPA: hypothetical protein VGB17_16445 [Pyrinomonadaceae bacterium]|jgi:hypothetical protein
MKKASKRKKKGPRKVAAAGGPPAITSIWQKHIKEQRALPDDAPLVETEFAGMPCILRRISVFDFLRADQVPMNLAAWMYKGINGTLDMDSALTPQEQQEESDFMRIAVCAVCVEPRITPSDAPKPGEFSYADVLVKFPLFAAGVYGWVKAGCPTVPVRMRNGETVDYNTVENFRQRQMVSSDGPGVRPDRETLE